MTRTSQLIGRVQAAVRRAWVGECALPQGPASGVLIGCSGGPDSTALLLSLASLQGDLGLVLNAAYVDHGLRPEAAAEGAAVLALCHELEIPAQVLSVTVASGPSRQSQARKARYRALRLAAQQAGLGAVAVAHTADDQAETVLMRLLQGSGLRGLGAMTPRRRLGSLDGEASGMWLLRPLLRCTRDEIAAFLAETGIAAVRDPSNEDARYLRSRLRHSILPLLRREHPRIERRLTALADSLREDARYLDAQVDAVLPGLMLAPQSGEEGAVVMAVPGLRRLPPALATRVVLRHFGALPARQVERVLALCERDEGSIAVDLAGGRRAERRYQRLLLQRSPSTRTSEGTAADSSNSNLESSVTILGPGRYRLGDMEIAVSLPPEADADPERCESPAIRMATKSGAAWSRAACMRLPAALLPMVLRRPRPGDRIALSVGRQRISDLLINAKVPRALRSHVVLLCRLSPTDGDSEVLWVVGLRGADQLHGVPQGEQRQLLLRLVTAEPAS